MSLIRNPPTVVKIVTGILTLFVIAAICSTCRAAELNLGYGRAIIRGPAPIATATVVWPNQIGNIDIYAGAILIGDYDYRGQHYPNQIVVRAGVTPHIGNFGVSLGVAALQNQDAINSGRLDFNLGLSYRIGSNLELNIGHVSNAGTHFPNLGRDLLSLIWRFR
jgi:hypothetical protein